MLVGGSSEPTATAAAERLRTTGADVQPFWGDVGEEGVAERALAAALAAWGRLDVWINNAAIIEVGEIAETSAADWDRVLAVNLRGVFLGCRTAAGFLKRQGQGGRILNASSVSGMRGGALVGAYAASKAGVIGLTQSLAAELGPHAITVNAYCPGNVTSTRMWEVVDRGIARIEGGAAGDAIAASIANQSIPRSGTEHEVAAVVEFLASEQASFVTGACYVVDGGALRVSG